MVLRPLERLKLTLAILSVSPTLLPFLPTLMILKGRPPRMPPSLSLAWNVLRITNVLRLLRSPTQILSNQVVRGVHSDFPFCQSLRSLGPGHSCTRRSFDPVFNRLQMLQVRTISSVPHVGYGLVHHLVLNLQLMVHKILSTGSQLLFSELQRLFSNRWVKNQKSGAI